MNYFYNNVFYSSFVGIYPYKSHHSKIQKAQNHCSSLWSVLNSKEIKSTNKLLLTNFLSHLLHRYSLVTRRKHDFQLSFYLNIYRFYQGWKHEPMLQYQKERVRKHTAHSLPSTNPGVHVLLIYSTQFRPSKTHNTLIAFHFDTHAYQLPFKFYHICFLRIVLFYINLQIITF